MWILEQFKKEVWCEMKKRKELCQRNRKNCGMGTVEMILIIVEIFTGI